MGMGGARRKGGCSHCRSGAKGAMAPPPAKVAPSNRIKVPQPGQILWKMCPSPVARFICAFCPTISLGPSP